MSLRSPTWSVIKFPDENSVCAVPTSWLLSNGAECYWPPYPQKLVRVAIEKHEMPDSTTWKIFPCTGFRNNIYDTFKEASKKSMLATKCSDLESYSDMEPVAVSSRKRKIFKKIYSFSSVEESEGEEGHDVTSLLPKPPIFKPQHSIKYMQTTNNDLCASSSQDNVIEDDGEELELSVHHGEDKGTSSGMSKKPRCSYNKENIAILTSGNEDYNRDCQTALLSEEHEGTPSRKGKVVMQSSTTKIQQKNRQHKSEEVDSKTIINYLQQIVRKQNILQSMITDLGNRMTNVEQGKHDVSDGENNESMFTTLPNLPTSNMEELHSLENYLSDAEQMRKAVNELSKIGGSNPYDFISRTAQKLITNKFSGATFSFQGRRRKESFQKLKLYELLRNASTTLFKDSTLKDVEQSIAKWIRRCAERGKEN